MQKANIPAEKLKSREQQQKITEGVCLGLVPFPFRIPLVWTHVSMFLVLQGWWCCFWKPADCWVSSGGGRTASSTAVLPDVTVQRCA